MGDFMMGLGGIVKFFFSCCFDTAPALETPLPTTYRFTTLQAGHAQVARPVLQQSSAERSPIRTEPRRIVKKDVSLFATADSAKKIEWKQVLIAMHKGLCEFLEVAEDNLSESTISDFKVRLHNLPLPDAKEQFRSSLLRTIQALAKANRLDISTCPQHEVLDQLMQALFPASPSKNELVTKDMLGRKLQQLLEEKAIYISIDLISLYSEELTQILHACFDSSDAFEKDFSLLKKQVYQLAKLLFKTPQAYETDPKQWAVALLFKLREALQRPSYKLLARDETQPCVHFLHILSLASFANVEAVRAYTHLGKKLVTLARIDPCSDLHTTLEKVRKFAADSGFLENDCQINDTLLSSLASWALPTDYAALVSRTEDAFELAFRHISADLPPNLAIENGLKFLTAYYFQPHKDYRGYYENNSSALFEETFYSTTQAPVKARTVLSPSPASGNTIMPEFQAVLQLFENSACAPDQRFSNYSKIAYNNLQSKLGGTAAESLQTKKLMQLPRRWPWSISCITISQEHLNVKSFDEQIKEAIFLQLSCEASFSEIENHPDFGYAFPEIDKQSWMSVFPEIVNLAYDLVHKNVTVDENTKITAFTEAVRNGIAYFHKSSVVATQFDQESIKDIIDINACATTTDRGGKVNCTFLHALSEEKRHEFVAQVFIGRAQMSKKRLPLSRRVRELGALSKVATQAELKKYFVDILRLVRTKHQLNSDGIRVLGNVNRVINFG